MTCRRTPDGPMLPTHRHDCEDAGCNGCRPCTEDHCTAGERCGRHVGPAELTCGECIGKTRRDIAQIVELAALMLNEAVARGVNSEAANLAGPAADPAGWEATQSERRAALNTITDEDDYEAALKTLLAEDDPRHPLTCLGWWEMAIRGDYGPDTTARITVASAAGYLDRMLHRLANDPAQDFPLFAREVRRCREHLEDIWHDSKRAETGAPCYMCGQANVEKFHREQRHVGCKGGKRNGCLRQDDQGYCVGTEGRIPEDGWKCPACRTEYTPRDYEARAKAGYVALADELTLRDMADRTGVAYSTLRNWSTVQRKQQPGKAPVEYPARIKAVRVEDGRRVYRVADVLAVRDALANDVACATVGHEGAS